MSCHGRCFASLSHLTLYPPGLSPGRFVDGARLWRAHRGMSGRCFGQRACQISKLATASANATGASCGTLCPTPAGAGAHKAL
jgi:hypothetical protein